MTDALAAGDTRSTLEARLADPEVAGALATLLDHADLLAVLVTGLDQLVSRSEVIGDSLVAGITELRASSDGIVPEGLDLASVARAGGSLAATLPRIEPSLTAAADSGALDELDVLARALVRGRDRFHTDPVEVGGPVSLLKLLKDPDINRAISYLATIAQAIGREVDPAQRRR